MADPIIETRNLTRRFGRLTAVDRLALEVPPAGVYGFLGPNGAGKTTTIRLLLGLIRPDEGTVRLFGRDLRGERAKLLGRVGALVESPSLYKHLSGRENLEVARRMLGLEKSRVDDALNVLGMERDACRKVGYYSLGMRQRLGLAQALLGRPEVLILDEPTNGLDPAGIQEIRELLRRLPRERGVGVFLSSHLLNEVEQVADRIGIIQRGRLRFQGTLEELRNRMRSRLILGVNRVEEALRKVQALGYSASPLGERGLAVATTDEDHAARINTALTTAGFKVWRLSVEHPSLEDIFLELTSGEETGGS